MRRKRSKSGLLFRTFFCASLIGLLSPDHALSQTAFYKGKTITIIQSTSPGGTGDLRVRALVSVLQRHIPENPTIVMEYMPGGGGRKAANHIYKAARPDGLTIGGMLTAFVSSAVLGATGGLSDLPR